MQAPFLPTTLICTNWYLVLALLIYAQANRINLKKVPERVDVRRPHPFCGKFDAVSLFNSNTPYDTWNCRNILEKGLIAASNCFTNWDCRFTKLSNKQHSTSRTAKGASGSFKNRKPLGEIGCYESRMAEQRHWWIDRWLRSPLFLFLSCFFSDYLPTYLSICRTYLSIYPSIHSSIHLSIYLSICTTARHLIFQKSGEGRWCFVHFDLKMCFAARSRLFPHLIFQKLSEPPMFVCFAPQRRAMRAIFWLPKKYPKVRTWWFFALWRQNALRATVVRNLSFFHLAADLASLFFDLPVWQSIEKTQCFETFPTFRTPVSSFLWLFLSLSLSLFCSSLLADSSHLCF